jgi:hypothetical protein
MTAKPDVSCKASEADQVDAYMRKLKHPLAEVASALSHRRRVRRYIVPKVQIAFGVSGTFLAPDPFCWPAGW